MEVQARLRYARISPTKMRLVADMIRGRKVQEAVNVLRFHPREASKTVLKVLNSAVANADVSGKIDVDTLYIKQISVDGGPAIKRFLSRAMGRATPIRRGTSHLRIILAER